jgi:hypothetical protein
MDTTLPCEAVIVELTSALRTQSLDRVPAEVAAHIGACPDCLGDYLLAVERLEAEGAGVAVPLQSPLAGMLERASGPTRRIVLSRAALALSLPPPQVALGPLRGFGADDHILFSDGDGMAQAQLTVMVRDSGNGTWEMVVNTTPPIVGLLRVSSGARRMTAPFANDGSATISAIPYTMLVAQEAPDVELIILPVMKSAG